MSWLDPPQRGDRWRKRFEGKTETRTVIDRTLGGAVCYVVGRLTAAHQRLNRSPSDEKRCTEAEWNAWVAGATRIDS